MSWDEPAVTIRTCGYHPMKGRYIHPEEHRGFNTVELMRLQAFPKDYRFAGGLISVGRQIGNAVPPPLAEAIGRAIRVQLERQGD
jgi:DNA (cytosine-5)-methyltransferase 1